ncbi:MAG: solute carrier family 23 protein, partial [Comamonas sp.]
AMVMFGMVAATGIRILSHVDFVENRKNAYIVAISLAMGMIPLVADRFFMRLPDMMAKFCQNGILLGTFTAVLLNVLFNAKSSVAPNLHTLGKAA